jgi:hypothetical protein
MHRMIINNENLFLCFMFYINNPIIILKHIYIIGMDNIETKNINFFHYIRWKKIINMSFIDFNNWIEEIMDNDYEYLKNYEYYGFRFSIYMSQELWDSEDLFLPQYPWNENFKNTYFKNDYLSKTRDNIIKKLKKENFILKKKIQKSKPRW